ncbi:ferritin-like domain-containing protein [Ketobacter sp. MCCC 1A13808]|uniref:ferritin-like domain-containing protein n=1 Tax=Ketobacter sp. MCCC 1A13808 TaxID=2602738 RepID=UPI000F2398B0|nr:ferritin-like domain-containing protein [Ketobacter sp. MCCC 1A13808]MVF12583.1 ferritin-like domain-containing protein [Ketobacter sp. MCCC 1A13808]RLP55617.1 MAG: ferritin-like domain-containing protein [Ketobacter sp.]
MKLDSMLSGMPVKARVKVEAAVDNLSVVLQMRNPRVLTSMAPSAMRGLVLKQGKNGSSVQMKSDHPVQFDFDYKMDFPEMRRLYQRAVENQWNADKDLPWETDVDPVNPEVPIISNDFMTPEALRSLPVKLTEQQRYDLNYHIACWMLSQFMHGEQGALYASAQVTESVGWMEGKLFGGSQVMDEARHLEVFCRYLTDKLGKRYEINDNLFVILDDLLTDARWDFKFLGMQIMVEGLALGAFRTIHNMSEEPLLKQMLKYVIRDEARHVHYGVLALKKHFTDSLSEVERREREDWAFEVAVLMRNRFMAHEIFEEWFEGTISRQAWNQLISTSPAMLQFRRNMFCRLIPNLDFIGLMSDRIRPHYARFGMLDYLQGKNASQLTEGEMMADLH